MNNSPQNHTNTDGCGSLPLAHGSPQFRVLVACEYSARVRDAFRALGCDAWSCDFEPCEGDPRWHIQGDVIHVLSQGWDLMVGHPSCTYLTNSGVCWLHKDPTRWAKLDQGAAFFRALWDAPIKHIALENPVMHKYAKERVGVRQTQTVQPWMFGHMESKATCLWLKNLPPLTPTENVRAPMMQLPKRERERLHYLPPSPTRWKERSRTYPGIARAMATQWVSFLANNRHEPRPTE